MSIIEKAVSRLAEAELDGNLGDDTEEAISAETVKSGRKLNKTVPALEPGAVPEQPESPVVVHDGETAPAEFGAADEKVAVKKATPVVEDRQKNKRKTSREIKLDLDNLSSLGIITPYTPGTMLNEQMRTIKRPLLTNAAIDGTGEPNSNLIMVTSALPGEGKTFISINLAMSMAMEMDRTVLLVDGDVNKSDVTRVLDIGDVEGVIDLLLNPDLDLADVLLKTNIPKLMVLPSGRHHENITELLASERMQKLLTDLAQRYHDRVIVFDSAPLLATTGARVLANLMGQLVMVVRAEKTLQSVVREALKLIEKQKRVGIVLNRSREAAISKYGYDYGYGYGYGYGGRNK